MKPKLLKLTGLISFLTLLTYFWIADGYWLFMRWIIDSKWMAYNQGLFSVVGGGQSQGFYLSYIEGQFLYFAITAAFIFLLIKACSKVQKIK